jgi:hypothetical protein
MSARALFANPALFSRAREEGAIGCPWHAIERFMSHAERTRLHPVLLQSHLVEMMSSGRYWTKKTKVAFMQERSVEGVTNFIDARYVRLKEGEEGFGEREMPVLKTLPETTVESISKDMAEMTTNAIDSG